MSKNVLMAIQQNPRIRVVVAGIGLSLFGATSAHAVMTTILGAPFEVPSPVAADYQQPSVSDEVFGPIPLANSENVIDLVEFTESETIVTAEIEESSPVEIAVPLDERAFENMLELYSARSVTQQIEVANIDAQPDTTEIVELGTNSRTIEMESVIVFRPAERFHAANPEATTPPVPLGYNARPIIPVEPASPAVIVAVRGESMDPLLYVDPDEVWPRRLDQIQNQDGREDFRTAQNDSGNLMSFDWLHVDFSGLANLVPVIHLGE